MIAFNCQPLTKSYIPNPEISIFRPTGAYKTPARWQSFDYQ